MVCKVPQPLLCLVRPLDKGISRNSGPSHMATTSEDPSNSNSPIHGLLSPHVSLRPTQTVLTYLLDLYKAHIMFTLTLAK
jgi:hypothetical protein